jgi:hypothetical protein
MSFRMKIRIAGICTLLSVLGMVAQLSARENIVSSRPKTGLKTTATGCAPALSAIDLDINNVRARLMTGGDMWWNNSTEVASYEIPKGSGRHSQFAASCWIGGFDKQGQLKVAAQTYRQDGNDYWPGALNTQGKITADTCSAWDKMWKIDRSTILRFVQNYKNGVDMTGNPDFDVVFTWPAVGNTNVLGNTNTKLSLNPNNTYAPFVDANSDGKYNPADGDYPDIRGDQYIWWVFNDAGNVKQQSLTASMGIEVQTSAFAYATQDFLNNSTFCNYRVINRGGLTIDSTYIAVWDDCDLGYYMDDYIGCDTSRGLGIQYNGNNDDGLIAGHPSNSYGLNPPQVGLDFFQGPKRIKHRTGQSDTVEQLRMTNFTYYNNDASTIGNPNNGIQIYYYMTGSIRNGQRFSNDFQGPGISTKGYGSGPISNFVFWGDPGDNSQWSECACNNATGDRRFIFSSGPFELAPGAVNDITFGCVWAAGVGGCGATTFKTIKGIDDGAQALFDQDFKTVEGPEAPRMVVRELDRKLVFYLVNDYGSNNYGENYGRNDGSYKDSLAYHQISVKSKLWPSGTKQNNDSLYRFEGYRVFQLKNSLVTSAEIFDPNTGEVDNSVAVEVFQSDVSNGVSKIVNYTKRTAVSDTTYVPQIKVSGRDSGISHSFVLTQDQFATGSDKRFVNYHNYYFVAVAYAYNNFTSFDAKNDILTQDVPYLGSSHGEGGTDIGVVSALPNPANGAMGTSLGSDYGSGVVITRHEGIGNGGNAVQLDSASEATIVTNNYLDKLTYAAGQGPVNVKVVDPVKVPAYDWVLQINGATASGDTGITNAGTWTLTALDNGAAVGTVYSERNIGSVNEQILEKYGISVEINQVLKPGIDQATNNGYITSSVSYADNSQAWLRGVQDQPDSNFSNWLRVGNTHKFGAVSATNPCNFNDNPSKIDTNAHYGNMLANFSPTKSTWGPYPLAAYYFSGGHYTGPEGTVCGFEVAAYPGTSLKGLQDVDVVFTSDKTKWTRCVVLEMSEDPLLAEGGAGKFTIRRHKGWNGEFQGDGVTVKYSDAAADTGMSWFPGYAISHLTGERLNVAFGEDSYLSGDHGNDMLWNPSSTSLSPFDNSVVFGGKHIVYVFDTRYDSTKSFAAAVRTNNASTQRTAFAHIQWVGVPTTNPGIGLLPPAKGFIPTETRLKFRVNRPYASWQGVDTTTFTPVAGTTVAAGMKGNPYYSFSTSKLAPHDISDGDTTDRGKLLSRILAVPNPYYGYSGYEKINSRYDTKVRIINLPAKVTINIYSLDGTLVRSISKSDPNVPYLDWDIRNTIGLPVASGMYLMDVKAEGIGEKVIKWFGATRPLDVSTY